MLFCLRLYRCNFSAAQVKRIRVTYQKEKLGTRVFQRFNRCFFRIIYTELIIVYYVVGGISVVIPVVVRDER